MKFDGKEIELKFTKALETRLFLNGNTPYDLSPILAHVNGGDVAFCSAWATVMGARFDGDFESFFKRFDFDIKEKAGELNALVLEAIRRDFAKPAEPSKAKNAKTKRRTA